ncbi:hypothetical protein OF829_08545 [Sphingomonas sp. LB-2]|uniref:hypothetical protein n=1 Tax=Sphingomonas caeni TaxID=2984949 RepID=UPI0022314D15|nr:hypothetical protein [Sphingomonas caeni]MCW3847288.1 hypothetical protein [Sphingomonas caeni]
MMIMIALMLSVQDAPAPKAAPARDPNKISCINQLKTGSRTNFVQICHSQAEWDLLRTENRRVVERGQANRGMRDPTGQ